MADKRYALHVSLQLAVVSDPRTGVQFSIEEQPASRNMRRDCDGSVTKFVFRSFSVLLQEPFRLPSIVKLEVFLSKFGDNYFQLELRGK